MVDLAPGGEGLAFSDGRPVYVPYAAPGDRLVAEVPAGSGPAHAAILELLAPGASRRSPPCPHFGPGEAARCGGCEWLHLDYAAQLAAKARAFEGTLKRIGRLEPGSYRAPAIAGSPAPLRYRSRAKFHLDRATGRLVFFRRRSHEAVQLRECHLLEIELDALREAAGPALVAARLDAREVVLEWSRHQRRGAAAVLLSGAATAGVRARAEAWLRAVPALAGVVLVPEGTAAIAVGEPVLRHERRPGDPAAGLQRSRPDVFQQANRGANARLVEVALDLLRPDGAAVLELYCGAGNFTAPLATRARAVHAIERQGPSLELARQDLAGAPVRFYAGDALAVARGLAQERGVPAPRFGAALLDPPREGARGVGAVLRELAVPRVVYVSCDPATFARDLRACGEAGYRIDTVQAVDLFPQTHHVEGVALLTRDRDGGAGARASRSP